MAEEGKTPDEKKRYSMADLKKRLRMSERRIRAYYRVGYFPQPIRDPGERGGYWEPWAIEYMEKRRERTHEFRMPKEVREYIERHLREPERGKRRQKRQSDRPTKLDEN